MSFRFPSRLVQLAAIPILILLALHGFILNVMPPLYIDEIATSAHTQSMLARGTDFNNNRLPLMSSSFGGGYTTSTYLYPLVAWSSVFGTSDQAIRAFSQFVTILAVVCIAASLYLWLGKRAGYIGLLVGLTLPWVWLNGSLAWDPAITPLYVSIAFLLFTLLARKELSSTKRSVLISLLTFSLVLAAYSYPPARVGAPLLLLGALGYFAKYKLLNWRLVLVVALTSVVVSLPLLAFILSPGSLGRSAELSVFSGASIIDGLNAVVQNIGKLLNARTLFLDGDSNLRHSTGVQGMLGLSSLIALGGIVYAFILRFKRGETNSVLNRLLAISILAIVAGLLGSALTSEGQPHYLRATTAWPFFVILISIGWLYIMKLPQYWSQLLVLTAAVLVSLYIFDLSVNYPDRAESWFGAEARTEREAKVLEYYQSYTTER